MPGKVIPLRPSDHSITEEQAHATLREREQQGREREAQGNHLCIGGSGACGRSRAFRMPRLWRSISIIACAVRLGPVVELDYLILRAGG